VTIKLQIAGMSRNQIAPVSMVQLRGYTMIEVVVVMAVIGILTSMALPFVAVSVQRQRESELKRAVWQIRDAIDAYRAARENGALDVPPGSSLYPPDLSILTKAHRDIRPEHAGQIIRFLRQVPRDPFASVDVPAEQCWGLRSYASESDRPTPGVDIYDVYSRSTKIGLNGIPLSQW
jgi:general secretion pathway protein G